MSKNFFEHVANLQRIAGEDGVDFERFFVVGAGAGADNIVGWTRRQHRQMLLTGQLNMR